MSTERFSSSEYISKGSFKKLGSIVEYLVDNIDAARFTIRVVKQPQTNIVTIEVWTILLSSCPALSLTWYPGHSGQIMIPTWMLTPPPLLQPPPYYHY